MNSKERMLNGLPYRAGQEGTNELVQERLENKKLLYEYNNLHPTEIDERNRLIREILGGTGEYLKVNIPFWTDYGKNIFVGENFYTNFNCVILDVARVYIGDEVMFGPNVAIYTASHPIHPESRNSGYESGHEVRIGNNCWLGGNTVVNPGVTIGDNVVIGSGSVVTKDIPANVVAAGNPCRVIREITEEDRNYYFKDMRFDVSDY